MWNLDLTYNFEASNTITIGNNTQPWGSVKHQATGDFIINSGTTVNMEAGQSVKLKSGFKLNDGANFKIGIDPSDPTMKSSEVQNIIIPRILGNKYSNPCDEYRLHKKTEYESVLWKLIGNNINLISHSEQFVMPNNLIDGQYTLIAYATSNSKTVASSKILVVKNINETTKDIFNFANNSCLIYPNPVNTSFTIKTSKETNRYYLNIRDLTGKVVLKRSALNRGVINIKVSHLKKGLYFVELHDNKNRLKIHKMLKK